jgi:hypothetical protein
VLRAAAIGAGVAVAGQALGRPPAGADVDDTGQVTLGAVLLSYASAPLNAKGSVTWSVTRQRTDTYRMSSQVLLGASFKADLNVDNGFTMIGGSAGLAQTASSQVTNGLSIKSSQTWSISTFASGADGYNTVNDTAFLLVLQPVANITGNPTDGFRWKFLNSGVKSARRVSELRDPAFRASIGAATADSVLAQYPLLQNVSGRALGLGTPRFKLKDQINPTPTPTAFDRTVTHGSAFSEQKTSQLTITIMTSRGFTLGPIKQAFEVGQSLQLTSSSVQEVETTNIISTSGQLTGERDHVNFLYVDRVYKTMLLSDEGPRSLFHPVISGMVTDQSGAPVSGALVSLLDTDGVYRTAQANPSGAYTIVRPDVLPPGRYTIVCAGIVKQVSVGSSGTGTGNYSGVNPVAAQLSAVPTLE